MPPASVISVTVGRSRSGNTSTGIWRTASVPATTSNSEAHSTSRRWRRLALISASNI